MKLPSGKSRLQLVKEGIGDDLPKRGRLVVNVEKIVEDPKNERKTFRNMEGLITSIKAVGVIEPLTVTDEGNGTYQIITGHRRFRAAKAAGLDKVEVIIREPEDERRRRHKSLVSNVQRENLSPVEMAEALQSLLVDDDRIKSQRDLAQVIGKDETWVSQMLRILDMPSGLQRKLETSQVSLPYDAVAKIARLKDAKLQKELVHDLLKGATNRAIRDKISQRAGRPTKTNTSSKPKQVYSTSHECTVIVQSKTADLSPDRAIAALEEALRKAHGDSSIPLEREVV